MNLFTNPRLLFATNTLPQVLLLLVFYSQYTLIRSQLDEQEIHMWYLFATLLGTLTSSSLVAGIKYTLRRQTLPATYAVLTLAAYSAYIISYYFNLNDLLPSRVPTWVLSEDSYFYTVTLLMPTLAQGVFILVARFTRMEYEPSVVASIIGAVVTPVAFVVLGMIPFNMGDILGHELTTVLAVFFFTTGTIAFIYFIVRSVYILAMRYRTNLAQYSLLWKIPLTLVFPLMGLALNNGLLFKEKFFLSLFGDFRHPLFYILAVVNAVLLCLPAAQNKVYRLVLYFLRFVTMAYTTYFFVVFLPYLPLSVVAIILVGLGALMLAPLTLAVVHVA